VLSPVLTLVLTPVLSPVLRTVLTPVLSLLSSDPVPRLSAVMKTGSFSRATDGCNDFARNLMFKIALFMQLLSNLD